MSATCATRISIGIARPPRRQAVRRRRSVRTCTHRGLHVGRQADPLGQQRRRRAVRVDEVRDVAAGVQIQRRDGLQPLQQRLAVTDVGQQEPLIRQPGPVHQVGAAAHRDVVAEPPRVFVRVGVTADPHDQRRVVDAIALGAGQSQPVGEPRRDQRRPQHVFGGLAEPEIDGHRQRRQNFRTGRKFWRAAGSHLPILRCRRG